MTSRRRLGLVSQQEERQGVGPWSFEKLARSTSVGSKEHRGLMHLMLTLCKPVIKSCVAPSAQSELLAGVEAARMFAQGGRGEGEIRQARARCFGAVRMIEDITAEAVEQAKRHLGAPAVTTPLDTHADRVTLRYGRLGAHFATSAVCHLLDATAQPSELLTVYGDLEGARAYLLTGLGAARHAPFRMAAWDQAQWEATRHRALADPPTPDARIESTLAVQVFHEYLGGRYRAQAEGIRSEMNAFIDWALASFSPTEQISASRVGCGGDSPGSAQLRDYLLCGSEPPEEP